MSIVYIRKKMGSTLKYILGGILLIFAAGIFVGFGPGGKGGTTGRTRATDVIARVNGTPIIRRGLLIQLDMERRGGFGAGLAEESRLKMMALERLISDTLTEQAMRDLKIRASREDVDAAMQEQIDRRTTSQDRRTLREYLQANNLTYDEYVQQVTEEVRARRREIEERVRFEKLRQTIESQVSVTDRDLRESYKRMRGRYIFIDPRLIEAPEGEAEVGLTKQERDALARAKAAAIQERLSGGADFAEVAKEESDDTFSAESGGDFGSLPYDTLKMRYGKEIADAVWALEAGKRTGVLKNDEGYYIFKCEEWQDDLPEDFEEKKEQERERLLAQRQRQHFTEYMAELRKNANVEILDPELKAYQLLMEEGKEAEAFALLQQALPEPKGEEDDPGDASINYELGQLAEKMNRPAEAEQFYRRAAKRAGDAPDLHIALGKLYRKEGQKDKALEHLKIAEDAARDLTFANASTHYALKGIYEDMGEKELAAAEDEWIAEFQESRPAPMFPSGTGGIPIRP